MSSSRPSAYTALQAASSLLLYQTVLDTDVGDAFLELLQTLHEADYDPQANQLACLQAYGRWFHELATHQQSWPEHLQAQIGIADNPFSREAQRHPLDALPDSLVQAARHDLALLQQLAEYDSAKLSAWVQTIAQMPEPPLVWRSPAAPPSPWPTQTNWADDLPALVALYQQKGIGLFAKYHTVHWYGEFVGIGTPDPVRLEQLVGYDDQKTQLQQNTEFLLQGLPTLNVLLYGSRGSGKSSLVKALVNHYHPAGLRLIEVTKSELVSLPLIVNRLRDLPQKFIIFVDDLSFEESEDDYKTLKVVLEGNITARPPNVVVYATTNRRHLIREFFGDRPRPQDGDEIHRWDTVQEKLSFSDRFGLTLTFEPASQDTYLQIVHHLAHQAKLAIAPETLEQRALQWATRHNGRSGRTARQFIDFMQAELATQTQ